MTQRDRPASLAGATTGRSHAGTSDRGRWLAAGALVFILASLFQGSRGLWEPDEGYYANAALTMARGGSLWLPRLNGQPFLDKPPLQYWAMAAGVRLLGGNEWGLRLANALWFGLTALVAGALSGRLWGARYRAPGTVAYGIMLGPFAASNCLTPDTTLTFFVTATAYAYWRSTSATRPGSALGWELLAGAATGMAALAKGPACLMFVLPLLLHGLWTRGPVAAVRAGLAILSPGTAVAMLWYVPVSVMVPGAATFLFDNEVWGRLMSSHYHRNSGWLGPLTVYLPMLLAGSLPWSALVACNGRMLRDHLRVRGRIGSRGLLVWLWLGVPLIILSLARSRLPLYLLPAMPAVAVAVSRWAGRWERPSRHWLGATRTWGLTVWVAALLVLKATIAGLTPPRDTRSLANHLHQAGVVADAQVVIVDQKRNALPAYGYENVSWVDTGVEPSPLFSPPESLDRVLLDLEQQRPRQVALVTKGHARPAVLSRLPPGLASCPKRVDEEFVIMDCDRPEKASLSKISRDPDLGP